MVKSLEMLVAVKERAKHSRLGNELQGVQARPKICR